MSRRGHCALGVVLAIGLVCASCSASNSDAANRSADALTLPTTEPTTTTAGPKTECRDASPVTASYAPIDPRPEAVAEDDPVMTKIRARGAEGKLRVAVDENTAGLASRNTATAELEGLEIDLARQLALAILGSADRVQFTTVTTKEKIQYAHDGKVDLSISAISMTCERWQEVAFSSEYFTARHAFLVREDSEIRAWTDVGDHRVCMTKGSTSIDVLADINAKLPTKAIPTLVDTRTDCLVALQEGEVDAYLGHDTFLVGMMDQDPNLRIVDQGDLQHYAIAINPDAVSFTQYVNGILQQLRDTGWFEQEYRTQLGPLYEPPPLPAVPTVDTFRPVP